MFKRYDYVPDHFGDYNFPDSLTEDIRNKRYTNAAESIIRHNIPFNYAFIFLSNSPEALSAYLLNSIPELDDSEFMNDDDGTSKDGEEEEQKEGEKNGDGSTPENAGESAAPADGAGATEQSGGETSEMASNEPTTRRDDAPKKAISPRSALLMNLYVAVTIPIISTKTGKERKVETEKMVQFCKKCKIALNKQHIYQICREMSDDDLAKSIYYIFGDIWEYAMILFENKQHASIFKELTRLPMHQRCQVIRRFRPDYIGEMIKNWLSGELPTGQAVYPFVVDFTYTLMPPVGNEASTKNLFQVSSDLKALLLKMYNRRQLTSAPQIQVFYHLIIQQDKQGPDASQPQTEDENPLGIQYEMYKKVDMLHKIGYDYILRHLERRQLYKYAAQLCSYEDSRHTAAITYAIGPDDDIQITHDVLMVDLAEAKDNKQCWMRALSRSKPPEGGTDEVKMTLWLQKLLVVATKTSKVPLDDVFKLMPDTLGIETFKPTILKTIKESQNNQNAANAKIDMLIKRSNTQRELIRVGPKMAINLDPIATCSICNMLIYTDRYLVFPCSHTVHVKCFLDSMHLYFDPIMRLNLISLSARAMRDEKRSSGLADIICNSCPICGELSINVLSKGFTIKQEQNSLEGQVWYLPPTRKKEEKEEESGA